MADDAQRGNPPLNLPSPDPSTLTTMALHEAVGNLRAVMEARLNAMDRAAEVLSENVNRVPTLLDRQIAQIKELHGEKFQSLEKQLDNVKESMERQLGSLTAGIALQFEERDVRSKASETSASTAVSAALQAQKEAAAAQNDANAAAITKSEASTVKQIDGIVALLASNTKAIDEKITSINGRLDRGEGAGAGAQAFRSERRLDSGAILAIAMACILAVGLIVSVLEYTPARSQPAQYAAPPAQAR